MLGNPHQTRALSGMEAMARPWLKRCLPRNVFEALTFWMRLGYWPNLRQPGTFNERISYRKLNEVPFAHPELVDKLAVREFVAARVGAEWLTRILRVFDGPRSVRLRDLPMSFALKCSSGSGMNLIIRDASEVSEGSLRRTCTAWLSRPYSEISHTYECIYDEVPAKIYVEELLGPPDTVQEYKCWCIGGQPEFIQVSRLCGKARVYALYDREWQCCPFSVFSPVGAADFGRPDCLQELLRLSTTLSEGFDFVRVDLLVSGDSRITFGELTFHPGGGRVRFFPVRYDFAVGSRIPLHSSLHRDQ